MEKPRYKLRKEAWIDDAIRSAGTEITYEGKPGYNLEPMNEPALEMYRRHNPQPEGVPQIKIETPALDIGWESKALAAGWTPPGAKVDWATPALEAGWHPPGFAKVDAIANKAPESTTTTATPPGRETKPSGAAGTASKAAGGGNQTAAGNADI